MQVGEVDIGFVSSVEKTKKKVVKDLIFQKGEAKSANLGLEGDRITINGSIVDNINFKKKQIEALIKRNAAYNFFDWGEGGYLEINNINYTKRADFNDALEYSIDAIFFNQEKYIPKEVITIESDVMPFYQDRVFLKSAWGLADVLTNNIRIFSKPISTKQPYLKNLDMFNEFLYNVTLYSSLNNDDVFVEFIVGVDIPSGLYDLKVFFDGEENIELILKDENNNTIAEKTETINNENVTMENIFLTNKKYTLYISGDNNIKAKKVNFIPKFVASVLYDLDASYFIKVYDTNNSNNEAEWLQVYNDEHEFNGEIIIDNSLLRLRLGEGMYLRNVEVTINNVTQKLILTSYNALIDEITFVEFKPDKLVLKLTVKDDRKVNQLYIEVLYKSPIITLYGDFISGETIIANYGDKNILMDFENKNIEYNEDEINYDNVTVSLFYDDNIISGIKAENLNVRTKTFFDAITYWPFTHFTNDIIEDKKNSYHLECTASPVYQKIERSGKYYLELDNSINLRTNAINELYEEEFSIAFATYLKESGNANVFLLTMYHDSPTPPPPDFQHGFLNITFNSTNNIIYVNINQLTQTNVVKQSIMIENEIELNTWQSWIFSFDFNTKTLRVFKDGSLIKQETLLPEKVVNYTEPQTDGQTLINYESTINLGLSEFLILPYSIKTESDAQYISSLGYEDLLKIVNEVVASDNTKIKLMFDNASFERQTNNSTCNDELLFTNFIESAFENESWIIEDDYLQSDTNNSLVTFTSLKPIFANWDCDGNSVSCDLAFEINASGQSKILLTNEHLTEGIEILLDSGVIKIIDRYTGQELASGNY